jgi:hypothetical protein
MIRNLMALPCLLAFVLACGQGRTDDQDTGAADAGGESGALPADTTFPGAGIDDTTAAPSDPALDTAAPAGGADPAAGDDTSGDTGSGGGVGTDSASQEQSGALETETGGGGDTSSRDTTY